VSVEGFGGLAEFPDPLDPHPNRTISNRGKNFFILWFFNSKFSVLIFFSPGGTVVQFKVHARLWPAATIAYSEI
jgi:hypothetical protein